MQDLVTELGGHVNVVTGPHNDSSPRVLLLMTLWWLGNQETFRQVADRFEIPTSIHLEYIYYNTVFCRWLIGLGRPEEMPII